jgi:colicin import membrane protein
VRTSGRCLAAVLALLLLGPVHAQESAVPDEEPQPGLEQTPPGQPAKEPIDQSPKEMIGSRWPVRTDDSPVPFMVRKTDRLGEALREAQAAQEAATKAAAEQAAADERAAERAAQRSSKRFTGRHGKSKRLAARGRARAAAKQAAAKGRGAISRQTARSFARAKTAGKALGKKQTRYKSAASRRHRA